MIAFLKRRVSVRLLRRQPGLHDHLGLHLCLCNYFILWFSVLGYGINIKIMLYDAAKALLKQEGGVA